MIKILKGQGLRFLNREGSFTVELALVFPIVMLGIVATIYILLFLYQYVFLQALVNKTASRGATEYGSILLAADVEENYLLLEKGREEIEEGSGGLYWQLTVFDNTDYRKQVLEGYIRQGLSTRQLLMPLKENIDVKLYDYIVYKKLRVRIVSEYQLPVLYVNRLLKIGNSFAITAEAEAVLKDSADLIRNTDYIYNLMDSFEGTSSIKNSYLKTIETWRRGLEDFFKE